MGEATLQARERPQQWLADRLSEVGPKPYTIQRIQNWKVRGIPRGEYPSIALAIGRSSDWVAGMESSERAEFGAGGIAASKGHTTLIPGAPIPGADHQVLRTALGRIAEKMRDAGTTKREMVAVAMRDIAVHPEALETTLGLLFEMLGTPDEVPAAPVPVTELRLAASYEPQGRVAGTKSVDDEVRKSRQAGKNAKHHKN